MTKRLFAVLWLGLVAAINIPVALAAPETVFEYKIPAQAKAIPALKARLDAQAAKDRAALADLAKDDERGSDAAPYQSTRTWEVVTDIPRFLSLSLAGYDYTGGAHGNPFWDSLVWDRVRGVALKPVDVFVSAAALRRAINRDWCAALDAQRRKKRGGDGRLGGIADFDTCIDPTQQTLLLGSRRNDRFDRIGIIAGPYAAGPYAEGMYEVTLPVTRALIAAVKPEYRPFFVPGR